MQIHTTLGFDIFDVSRIKIERHTQENLNAVTMTVYQSTEQNFASVTGSTTHTRMTLFFGQGDEADTRAAAFVAALKSIEPVMEGDD